MQGVILYIIRKFPPDQRTLMKLRQTVALGDWDLFEEFVQLMKEDDPDYESPPGKAYEMLLDEMMEMDDYGGIIREAAGAVRRFGEQTQGNILANAMTNLNFLKDPLLCDNLIHTDDPETTFSLSELRDQDQHLTVYLCLPTKKMPVQGKWLKLIAMQIMDYVQSTEFDKSRDYPILMMLDEFYQLGPIPSIANTLTFASSYGLRLWLIIQDLGQLKTNYPKEWETIFGACGIKQFFGFNDNTTAEYVSKLLGDTEIEVPSINYTINRSQTSGQTDSETEGTSHSQSSGVTLFSHGRGDDEGYHRFNTDRHKQSHSQGTSSGTSDSATLGSGQNIGTGMSLGTNMTLSSGQSDSATHNYSGGAQGAPTIIVQNLRDKFRDIERNK